MAATPADTVYKVGRQGVIYIGDARAILAQLPGQSVPLVVTSPSYQDHKSYGDAPHPDGLGRPQLYADCMDEMAAAWRLCCRAILHGGKLIFNSANMKVRGAAPPRLTPIHRDLAQAAESAGFTYYDEILRLKQESRIGSSAGRPRFVSYQYPGNPKMLNHLRENIAVMHKPGNRQRTGRRRDSQARCQRVNCLPL